jgi:arylformamidase
MKRIVNLSVNLDPRHISLVPGHPHFELREFQCHEKDLRSNSYLQVSIHTGTHVDAPYHFVKGGI